MTLNVKNTPPNGVFYLLSACLDDVIMHLVLFSHKNTLYAPCVVVIGCIIWDSCLLYMSLFSLLVYSFLMSSCHMAWNVPE